MNLQYNINFRPKDSGFQIRISYKDPKTGKWKEMLKNAVQGMDFDLKKVKTPPLSAIPPKNSGAHVPKDSKQTQKPDEANKKDGK